MRRVRAPDATLSWAEVAYSVPSSSVQTKSSTPLSVALRKKDWYGIGGNRGMPVGAEDLAAVESGDEAG